MRSKITRPILIVVIFPPLCLICYVASIPKCLLPCIHLCLAGSSELTADSRQQTAVSSQLHSHIHSFFVLCSLLQGLYREIHRCRGAALQVRCLVFLFPCFCNVSYLLSYIVSATAGLRAAAHSPIIDLGIQICLHPLTYLGKQDVPI